MNFSAFILFEFWDSPPNDSILLNENYNGPTVRILLNPTPFKNIDGSASRTVQTNAIRLLNDYKVNDIVNILQELRLQTKDLYMKPIKKEKEAHDASQPITNATALNDSSIKQTEHEQETEIDMLS